jgi:hypothetical protein
MRRARAASRVRSNSPQSSSPWLPPAAPWENGHVPQPDNAPPFALTPQPADNATTSAQPRPTRPNRLQCPMTCSPGPISLETIRCSSARRRGFQKSIRPCVFSRPGTACLHRASRDPFASRGRQSRRNVSIFADRCARNRDERTDRGGELLRPADRSPRLHEVRATGRDT